MESALHTYSRSIGQYELIAELGQGGMAEVFLAVARGPAGFVKLRVLKRLKADLALDPEFHTMFLDEARLAARLDHPNIVHTVEVQEDQGLPFIAMEYIEGEPLSAIVRAARDRGGQLPLAAVLRILCDALAGLHHAHEAKDFDGSPLNIVHRDITPHNILVSYEGHAKVVDFGIAKARISATQTASGVIKGKITYLSPEQAKGDLVDRRSDVFSVGVMLYEAMAGQRMWGDLVDYQILTKLATGELPSTDEHTRHQPPELIAICKKALALDPTDRFASALAFQEAIEAFLELSNTRFTHKDVGGIVVDLFREKRRGLQDVIERELAVCASGAPIAGPLPQFRSLAGYRTPSLSDPTKATEVSPASGHRAVGTAPGLTSTPDVVVSAPRTQRLGMLGVVVGGLLIVAVTGVLLTRSSESESTASTSASSLAVPIRLSLTATPATARILVDGTLVEGNPHQGTRPLDSNPHEVRFEADGYASKSVPLRFDNDVEMRVELEPLQPAASVSASADVSPAATRLPARPPPTPNATQRPLDMDDPWK